MPRLPFSNLSAGPIVRGPVAAVTALLVGLCSPALAQERERLTLEVEGGPVWQTRNDVRVPNDGGTDFSLVDLIGSGPSAAFRVDVGFDPWEKHGFRAVIAPLVIDGEGSFDEPVSFAGESFAAGVSTEASYQFSSYRFTYRYRFFKGSTWTWKGELTAFVRDARIALRIKGMGINALGHQPAVHFPGGVQIPNGLGDVDDSGHRPQRHAVIHGNHQTAPGFPVEDFS